MNDLRQGIPSEMISAPVRPVDTKEGNAVAVGRIKVADFEIGKNISRSKTASQLTNKVEKEKKIRKVRKKKLYRRNEKEEKKKGRFSESKEGKSR